MNRKIEDKINRLESSIDDLWFWVFVVGILIGFTGLKINQNNPQSSIKNETQTTQSELFQSSKDTPKFIYPLPSKTAISSGFGMRIHPISKEEKMHTGVDLGAATGTNIYAIADGIVEDAGEFGACGKGVKVKHSGEFLSVYCHASKLLVNRGQSVKSGDVIALVGSTGTSTAPHLHFGLKHKGEWVNPIKFVPLK